MGGWGLKTEDIVALGLRKETLYGKAVGKARV